LRLGPVDEVGVALADCVAFGGSIRFGLWLGLGLGLAFGLEPVYEVGVAFTDCV